MSIFYVYKDSASQWRWKFVANNNKIIADSSEGYHNLSDCEHGVSLIKSQSPGSTVVGDDAYSKLRP